MANSKAVNIRFLAARTFVEADAAAKARPLLAGLASELQAEPQAYAKILEGQIALKGGDPRQAIKALTNANELFDTWIGHFYLGRAYLAAGALPQADGEFDRCIKRLVSDSHCLSTRIRPTQLPPVYYAGAGP